MKKIISFLKTDIKVLNSYFLITMILVLLILVGYTSYALFTYSKTSTNVIEGEVGNLSKSGVDTLIKLTNNQNNSGLYTITHPKDTTLQIGNDKDIIEYRYRGANPKNYVKFNNEVWRIIGIFPTDDGTGKIENRIKLIKDQSIGKKTWDNNGRNNWVNATLNVYLNNTYYNNLSNSNYVAESKYYLGGYVSEYLVTVEQIYQYERKISGSTYYRGTNPNSWVGKVALMYASDYGYASANCETKKLYNKNASNDDIRVCNDTNWLYNKNTNPLASWKEWLLPQNSSYEGHVYMLRDEGMINNYTGTNSNYTAILNLDVRPTLYLKTDVKITGGDGTSSNPYILGI